MGNILGNHNGESEWGINDFETRIFQNLISELFKIALGTRLGDQECIHASGNIKSSENISVKDTLKAFDSFKSKQQKFVKCNKIRKSMYILKVYSIHYTLR